MTWHYKIADDYSQIDIWDHSQDPATDSPLKTIQNDGSGFTTTDNIPRVVLDAMQSEVDAELPEQANAGNATSSSGLSPRGGFILRDMAARNVEEYTG